MSPKLRLKAVVREATQRGREGIEAAKQKARQLDQERYERTAQLTESAAKRTKSVTDRTFDKRDELTARAARTRVGGAIGKASQRFGSLADRLPILSIPADLMREKRNILELTQRVRERPHDAYCNLWLAEALQALERDMRLYVLARTTVSPTAILTREAMQTAARLGTEAYLPPAEKMLRRAYHLAAARLRRLESDADALDVIARVYLAKGKPDVAVKPAKAAVAQSIDQERGGRLATLARAYLACGHNASARCAADLATKAGCSIGYEVLAELVFRDGSSSSRERYTKSVDLSGKVTEKDATAYYGTHRPSGDIVRAVLDRQMTKTRDAAEKIRAGLDKLQNRLRSSEEAEVIKEDLESTSSHDR